MKKFLIVISLIMVLCSVFTLTAFASGAETASGSEKADIDEMPPMEFDINWDAFVDSLALMGQGLAGIFIVTLVIIGVVAILNWHGRSLERRNNKKD